MHETFETFSASLKSKLCEFQSSSFLISFLISMILVNHKYLMIYYSDIDPHRKLLMLEHQHICILIPLIIAICYVYVYPFFARKFYSVSLEYGNKFKETKVEKLNKRILDEDDEKNLVRQIEKLNNELEQKNKFVSKMDKKYKDEIALLEEKENDMQKFYSQNIKDEQKKYDDIKNEYEKQLSESKKNEIKLTHSNEKLLLSNKAINENFEKFKIQNTRSMHEASQVRSGVDVLLNIIKKYEKFKNNTTEEKVKQLLSANVAFNQIDEVLNLEKGYTQKIRSKITIPSNKKTTDEMIIRELHMLGESDIKLLLNRFKDLTEESLKVKLQKLKQEVLVNTITGTNSFYVTDIAKSRYGLK